jgi:hypothetical protein
MWICDEASTISTASEQWRTAVVQSGRFSSYHWRQKRVVSATTVDLLIEQYGVPRFCKIDVEGFESEVLQGLSRPIATISFEFTYPECFGQAIACMNRLRFLGGVEFNFSLRESMALVYDEWVGQDVIETQIGLFGETMEFGDIYARYDQHSGKTEA